MAVPPLLVPVKIQVHDLLYHGLVLLDLQGCSAF